MPTGRGTTMVFPFFSLFMFGIFFQSVTGSVREGPFSSTSAAAECRYLFVPRRIDILESFLPNSLSNVRPMIAKFDFCGEIFTALVFACEQLHKAKSSQQNTWLESIDGPCPEKMTYGQDG